MTYLPLQSPFSRTISHLLLWWQKRNSNSEQSISREPLSNRFATKEKCESHLLCHYGIGIPLYADPLKIKNHRNLVEDRHIHNCNFGCSKMRDYYLVMTKEKWNSNSSDITTIITIWLFLPKTVRIFERFRIEEVCSVVVYVPKNWHPLNRSSICSFALSVSWQSLGHEDKPHSLGQ